MVSFGFKTMVPAHRKKSQEHVNNSPGAAAIDPIREESESESSQTEEDNEEAKAKSPELGRKLTIYDEEDKTIRSPPNEEDEEPLQSGMFVV